MIKETYYSETFNFLEKNLKKCIGTISLLQKITRLNAANTVIFC